MLFIGFIEWDECYIDGGIESEKFKTNVLFIMIEL